MTNADRIRSMSDEDLAAFLVNRDCKTCDYNCAERMRECNVGRCLIFTENWLKQEVIDHD